MKSVAVVVLCTVLLVCQQVRAQNEKELRYGSTSVSPDGRVTARLVEALFPTAFDPHPTSKTACLSIEDKQNKTTSLVGVLSPVFHITWTKDSKSIITVEHIADGTQVAVLHDGDGRWQRHEVEPLSEDQSGHYAVVNLKTGNSAFDVTFKVADDSEGKRNIEYNLCTFRVDGTTGAITKAGARHKISGDTYVNTLSRVR